jgi:hypothetical protein
VFEYFDDPWLAAEFDLLRLVDLGADIMINLLNYVSKDTSNEEEAQGNIDSSAITDKRRGQFMRRGSIQNSPSGRYHFIE